MKIKVAFIIIACIVLNSGYFLWQIDRHEKALIGQEWLNSVPYNVWNKYVKDKDTYEKSLRLYKENNTELVNLIAEYNNKETNKTIKNKGFVPFTVHDAMLYMTEIPGFEMSKTSQLELSSSNPEEFKIWEAIMVDLKNKKPKDVPAPTNPPKALIQQEISSLYRYFIFIDSILLISLIIFVALYKEKGLTPCEK